MDWISKSLLILFIFAILIAVIIPALGLDPERNREKQISEDKKTEMYMFVKLTKLSLKLEQVRLERDKWEHEMNKLDAKAPEKSSA